MRPKQMPPSQDQSMDQEALMQKIEGEIKRRFGGKTIDEFLEELKLHKNLNDDGEPLKNKGKSKSLNLDRDLEEDDRRVNTDPLDPEKLEEYLSRPNPFLRNE
mmetsp:Transcript_22222/g.16640  ORF Transcript_22222/g.16640 Transcript_22222/m.16640 type:complete len:103 (+) Transcript_22222:224-532(+)